MEQKKGMPKWLKWVGIILIGLFVIGLIVPGDKKESTASESTASPVESAVSTPTAMTVSANEIVNDYIANEVAADNKYKGKKVQISGTINDIGKDITDDAYITLQTDNNELRSVQVYIEDQQSVAALQKGQKVTVQGICDGLMMNVQIRDGKLL